MMAADAVAGLGPDALPRRQLVTRRQRRIERLGAPATSQPLGQQGLQIGVMQAQSLGQRYQTAGPFQLRK